MCTLKFRWRARRGDARPPPWCAPDPPRSNQGVRRRNGLRQRFRPCQRRRATARALHPSAAMMEAQKHACSDVRGPMDTLVDAPTFDVEPATERAPAPNPADFRVSETRIGLFGLEQRVSRARR